MHFHTLQAKVCPDAPAVIQPKISDQISVHISKLGSSSNFPTKMPSTSPSSGPFQNFQAITPQLPQAQTHSQPKHNFITRPKLNAFMFSHQENIHPRTQPTTHLTFPPRLLPLTPYRLRLTHGLYQAVFAAPWVTMYLYSRLDPTSGSSPGCKSQIQL